MGGVQLGEIVPLAVVMRLITDRGGIGVTLPIGQLPKTPSNDLHGIEDIYFLQVLASGRS
jgi:hypothetical protein